MTDEEILEVVQAHKEGKQIEVRPVRDPMYWARMSNTPIWNFADYDYRVKPEPRKPREWVLAVVKTDAGDVAAHPDFILNAKDVKDIETVRVREVIEE